MLKERYIKGTSDLKLLYRKTNDNVITGYADAEWGGDTTDRKSASGYCFLIFGCYVPWASKKQSTAALSTTEAEYIALSFCISEACWFKNFILELNLSGVDTKVVLCEDNQSAIRSCNPHEQLKRIKHLDIKYHFIKDRVNEGIVDLGYINYKMLVVEQKSLNILNVK